MKCARHLQQAMAMGAARSCHRMHARARAHSAAASPCLGIAREPGVCLPVAMLVAVHSKWLPVCR